MNNAAATHLGIRLEAAFSERLQNQEYSRAIVAAKELYQVVASCESAGCADSEKIIAESLLRFLGETIELERRILKADANASVLGAIKAAKRLVDAEFQRAIDTAERITEG